MASIAVIGGTGQLGKGIARRLAKAGHNVTIGSRSAEKAQAAAEEMAGLGIGNAQRGLFVIARAGNKRQV